MNMKPISFEI